MFFDAALLVVGGVSGFLVGWLLLPWFTRPQQRLERVARRMTGAPPLTVEVEQNPAAIYGGAPDWIAFAGWIPSTSSVPRRAPEKSRDIVSVANAVGGTAAVWQHVQFRFTAEVSCVLEQFAIEARPIDSLSDGTVLRCPVGGADAEPRRIRIDFGNDRLFRAVWRPEGVDRALSSLRLKLAPGEIEELLVDVSGAATDYAWSLSFSASFDGRQVPMRVPGEDDLVFRSGSGLPTKVGHSGGVWEAA